MHCKTCGAEINDNAKFCGVCGTPVVMAANETDGAIYVEAQPHVDNDNAALIADLQESLHESIVSLARAAAFSAGYIFIVYWLFMKNTTPLVNVLPMVLVLIGPWKIIITLYKSGFRLPSFYGWGPLVLVLFALKLFAIVFLPILVLMAIMGLGNMISGVIPFVTANTLVTIVAFWPVASLVNIIYKAIRIHMLKA